MFDFLNEYQKKLINQYEPLKFTGLKKYPEDYKTFLTNLSAFRGDLLKATFEYRGARYSVFFDEDIDQIKDYVSSILSGRFDQIKKLRDRVLKEAGFEVYAHGGSRQDINDWAQNWNFYSRIQPYDLGDCYSRGIYNLNEYLLAMRSPGVRYPILYQCGLVPQRVNKQEIMPQLPSRAKTGHIKNLRTSLRAGAYNVVSISSGTVTYNFDWTPYYRLAQERNQPIVLPFYLVCCIFGKEIRYETKKVPTGRKKTVARTVPHRFLGKFGVNSKENFEEDEFFERETIVGGQPFPLNQIVVTDDATPAYLLQFCLPKTVLAIDGRPSEYQNVNLVASKNLLEEIINFLLEHPNFYMDLIRAILPNKMFPNINNWILNAEAPNSSRGLIFDNYTSNVRITVDK